jgi:hypothetical protein
VTGVTGHQGGAPPGKRRGPLVTAPETPSPALPALDVGSVTEEWQPSEGDAFPHPGETTEQAGARYEDWLRKAESRETAEERAARTANYVPLQPFPWDLHDGSAFLYDGSPEVESIWGRGDEVLWSGGESLVLTGPPGVGKTTLAGQVLRARLTGQVLGYPVTPTGSKVLYLAMDRPRQIRRSLLRQFGPEDQDVLAERLQVWSGPPYKDLAKHPGMLLEMAGWAQADTVVLDSLKDAFIGLTDDDASAAYNRARQIALQAGVQVIELHHQVKRGVNSSAPTTLADVYGMAWITAGAGSVILLWGQPGDLVVQLRHLKQPAAEVGPFQILHDHSRGVSTIHRGADLKRLAEICRSGRADRQGCGRGEVRHQEAHRQRDREDAARAEPVGHADTSAASERG